MHRIFYWLLMANAFAAQSGLLINMEDNEDFTRYRILPHSTHKKEKQTSFKRKIDSQPWYIVYALDGGNILYRVDTSISPYQPVTKISGNTETAHIAAEYIKQQAMLRNSLSPAYAAYYVKYQTEQLFKYFTYPDLLDPFLLYGLYAYTTQQKITPIPLLSTGDFSYLPAMRMVRAPYGQENRFIVHMLYKNQYVQMAFRHGRQKKFTSYTIESSTNLCFQLHDLQWGTDIALWSQPRRTDELNYTSPKLGGQWHLNTSYPFTLDITALASLGYKTDGFMEGLPFRHSILARIGIQMVF